MRDNLARLSDAAAQFRENPDILNDVHKDLEQLESQVAWLRRGQRSVSERVTRIEQSLLFRTVRWPGVGYARIRNLINRWIPQPGRAYKDWVAFEQRSLVPDRAECLKRIARFTRQPLITIVLVVREPQSEWFQEALRSVTEQIYPSWELCICLVGVSDRATDCVAKLAESHAAVRFVGHPSTPGLGAVLNSLCSQAKGEYIGFLNQHDVLSPHALFCAAEAIQRMSPALLYSDEDSLSEDGQRMEPLLKPAWSPELLLSKMYMSSFLVVSAASFRSVGGFQDGYEGAQDLDLCLRITEQDEQVAHIPRILYHRRKCSGVDSKRREVQAEVHASAIRALQAAAHRRGWTSEVVQGDLQGTFRIRRAPVQRVSIVICSRSPNLLENALSAIRSNTEYPAYEIVVAEHCPDGENPAIAQLASRFDCVRIPVPGPFNFSRINNLASECVRGQVLVFLNDDVRPLRSDWLSSMASHLELDEIGVVGARLLYPSGAIQHAGIVVGIGEGAGHVNRNKYRGDYWNWVHETRNVSAVTGACLGIRAGLFRRVGGFDTEFPNNYNDVDLCLRVRDAGFRVVYEPGALLRHYEGQTRHLFVEYEEQERFYLRWREIIERGDPYYNPNLLPAGEETVLSLSTTESQLFARRVTAPPEHLSEGSSGQQE